MKTIISHTHIPAVKAQLRLLAPDATSSNRAEAMARGLGFQTSISMKSLFGSYPREIDIDDEAFAKFLADHGTPISRRYCLSDAVYMAQHPAELAAVEAVLAKMPDLSANGLRHRGLSATDFDRFRKAMLDPVSIQEFELAVIFLSRYETRATFNTRRTSYGLKHEAERFHQLAGSHRSYMTNGIFIAAAVHLGFKIKQDGSGPNAYLNIASSPGTPSTPSTPGIPGGLRTAAWRNLIIAAINAGLDQQVFGLEADDNRWEGGHHIYSFKFEGLPALGYVHDIGYGELSFHAAVQPTARGRELIPAWNAGFAAGDAFATGFLERKDGKWPQVHGRPGGSFRKDLLPIIASAKVMPKGFQDNGPMR